MPSMETKAWLDWVREEGRWHICRPGAGWCCCASWCGSRGHNTTQNCKAEQQATLHRGSSHMPPPTPNDKTPHHHTFGDRNRHGTVTEPAAARSRLPRCHPFEVRTPPPPPSHHRPDKTRGGEREEEECGTKGGRGGQRGGQEAGGVTAPYGGNVDGDGWETLPPPQPPRPRVQVDDGGRLGGWETWVVGG